MLRRDFISKIIEQMFNAISQLLKVDFEKEPEIFEKEWDEILKTYFNISSDKLSELLESNDQHDVFLLDEKLKNAQLGLFARAGLVFAKKEESEKAKICLEIIQRIQEKHSSLFEFPSQESLKIENEISTLKSYV